MLTPQRLQQMQLELHAVVSSAIQVNAPSAHYICAGKYNLTALWGLDYILDVAAKNGVKVLFTFADNWKMSDSKSNVRLACSSTFASPFSPFVWGQALLLIDIGGLQAC